MSLVSVGFESYLLRWDVALRTSSILNVHPRAHLSYLLLSRPRPAACAALASPRDLRARQLKTLAEARLAVRHYYLGELPPAVYSQQPVRIHSGDGHRSQPRGDRPRGRRG